MAPTTTPLSIGNESKPESLSCCGGRLDAEYDYHEKGCEVAKRLRDCWRTPLWLCDQLGRFAIDPCPSQYGGFVHADCVCLNGLETDWYGRAFVNPPYSDMAPWITAGARAYTLGKATEVVWLVKLDPSTQWWRGLVFPTCDLWLFRKRLAFVPPPRIKPSSNNFCSAIVHWRGVAKPLDLGGYADRYVR